MMTKKFPSLLRETDIQVQEAQRVPNKMKTKRHMTRHTIIDMSKLKIKRQTSKQQEKNFSYIRGNPHKTIS